MSGNQIHDSLHNICQSQIIVNSATCTAHTYRELKLRYCVCTVYVLCTLLCIYKETHTHSIYLENIYMYIFIII